MENQGSHAPPRYRIAEKVSGRDSDDQVGKQYHMNYSMYANSWVSVDMWHDEKGNRSGHVLVLPSSWDDGNNLYTDPHIPENQWKILS